MNTLTSDGADRARPRKTGSRPSRSRSCGAARTPHAAASGSPHAPRSSTCQPADPRSPRPAARTSAASPTATPDQQRRARPDGPTRTPAASRAPTARPDTSSLSARQTSPSAQADPGIEVSVKPGMAQRGQVDEDQVAPAPLQPLDRALAAVVGAVVDDPEDAPRGGVGLLGHHLPDEPVKRLDSALGLAASDHAAMADIPGIEVAKRAHPLVLVLDQLAAARAGRGVRVDPRSRLDRGFRVGADHHVSGLEQLALPAALVEIKHPPGLLDELRVAREDPGALLPRLDRVLREPASDRRCRRLADGPLDNEAVQLSAREARQRQTLPAGQLARDRLDLGDLFRGENDAGGPRVRDPQAHQGARRGSVSASAQQRQRSSPAAVRSRRSWHPRPRRAPASRAAPAYTEACNTPLDARAPSAPPPPARSNIPPRAPRPTDSPQTTQLLPPPIRPNLRRGALSTRHRHVRRGR